jgi:hypothetical protein
MRAQASKSNTSTEIKQRECFYSYQETVEEPFELARLWFFFLLLKSLKKDQEKRKKTRKNFSFLSSQLSLFPSLSFSLYPTNTFKRKEEA